jgi:hypothetical protein
MKFLARKNPATESPEDSQHLALLALGLQTQHALRRHRRLELRLPQQLVEGTSRKAFEAIMFDALSCEFPDLNQRLSLLVGPYEKYSIQPLLEGKS